jgi:hypothetical protein
MKFQKIKIKSDNDKVEIETSNTKFSIHLDLQGKDYHVNTYGGEWVDDDGIANLSYYGIQIEDFSIEISTETAIKLCQTLKKHLESNYHKIA